jgi:hypothetical protein
VGTGAAQICSCSGLNSARAGCSIQWSVGH